MFPFTFQLSGDNYGSFFYQNIALCHIHIFWLLWAMLLLATPQAIERGDKNILINSGFVRFR